MLQSRSILFRKIIKSRLIDVILKNDFFGEGFNLRNVFFSDNKMH